MKESAQRTVFTGLDGCTDAELPAWDADQKPVDEAASFAEAIRDLPRAVETRVAYKDFSTRASPRADRLALRESCAHQSVTSRSCPPADGACLTRVVPGQCDGQELLHYAGKLSPQLRQVVHPPETFCFSSQCGQVVHVAPPRCAIPDQRTHGTIAIIRGSPIVPIATSREFRTQCQPSPSYAPVALGLYSLVDIILV